MRKAFISPAKYVQGENELLNLGFYIKSLGESALVIGNPDDIIRVEDKLNQTAKRFGINVHLANFGGEATREEVVRLKKLAKEKGADVIVGLGGGKAIDTSKTVANGHNLIVCPTIAATDAPTSHSAVLYTKDHHFDEYAYFIKNPSVVLMDTTVIAQAPTRFLVSGMGDALATYYEARATRRSNSNVNAGLPNGFHTGDTEPAKGTIASITLAKVCYETVLESGYNAKIACDHNVVTPALENIIEANTLLSGLGFESGGLAAAHAIYNGLTVLDGPHNYFHGEQVAFTTFVQLILEDAPKKEVEELLDFSLSVGLPVSLADLDVKEVNYEDILKVAEKACIPEESIHAMPFKVTPESVAQAIIAADALGRDYKKIKAVK
ncbi:glycerol dehydrogenase [Carnobacterium funditum]|uniref:glycerol dehydrogenase n=1 Tax=Carnobacterium funditum TaxID=2752 RepID=UPI00055737CE|nr:glycerol dehydrogenase [Carnobacterium funditum]